MKRLMKWALLLTAVLTLSLGLAATAWAADEADKITITGDKVGFGDIDLGNLDIKGSHDLKEIWIEGDALAKAEAQGKNLTFVSQDMKFIFPVGAFYTSDWNTAKKRNEPMEIELEIDTDAYIDLAQHFNEYAQKQKGNYLFYNCGIDIEANIYVAGKNEYTIKNFAKPFTIVYNYSNKWKAMSDGLSTKNITMAWYDLDKELANTQEWQRLASKVDTDAQTVTISTTYACGFFMPLACKGVDNVNGGSVSIETGNGSGSVAVVTGGVPAGHWAASDIEAMQQAGIVPADLSAVQVNKPITRAEFAAYVVRTLGLTEDTSLAGKFTDIKSTNPYYKEILTGAKNGIISGVSASQFSPNANITRQEMAALFTRALEKKSVAVNKDNTKLGGMKDAASISTWAKESCAIVMNAGLITGKEGNKFGPKDNTTWAEAVVMLNRLYAKVK